MQSLMIGQSEIFRVIEWSGDLMALEDLHPAAPSALLSAQAGPRTSDWWDPDTGAYLCNIQTWVARHDGLTIVIDTGIGNDRSRPGMPAFDHMHTTFLDDLSDAGVKPDEVDIVVNTHIHYDHVGWNTRLVGDTFEPTFPHATYLIPEDDLRFFSPSEGRSDPPDLTTQAADRRLRARQVFADSIAPLIESARVRAWRGRLTIAPGLVLARAPGHTPGSSVVWLTSDDERAVFVGDMIHSPLQLVDPGINSCFCQDPARAAQSRRDILGQAADVNALVIPGHLREHYAARMGRAADGSPVVLGWIAGRESSRLGW